MALKLVDYLVSKVAYSRKFFVGSISENNSLLEIGPFFNPMCVGKNVQYFDIINQKELIERAKSIDANINLDNIPFIDFVSPTGDLSIIDAKFDTILSCHVIEHQLDFINHLQQISALLNAGGQYFMIIPDKRYCFDHFNNPSTIADILNAHFDKRSKHSLKSVIEHLALTTHNKSSKHWRGQHGKLDDTTSRIQKAINEFQNQDYIDVHAWYFTPKNFTNIIELLNELGYIDLKIDRIHKTPFDRLEFYVVLKK